LWRGYFENDDYRDAAALALFLVNSGPEIIFNGLFESHFFARKREKSRILPRKRFKTAAVYQARIKHGAAP
jgi:hypothetical protein